MTTYKHHTITRTNVTTSVLLPLPGGRQYEAVRRVYAIEGRYGKSAWVRPFITSLAGAREHINDELEHEQLKAEEWEGIACRLSVRLDEAIKERDEARRELQQARAERLQAVKVLVGVDECCDECRVTSEHEEQQHS